MSNIRGSLIRAGRIVRNAAIDLRHGSLLGINHLRAGDQSNSDYRSLERIFDGRIEADDVLVDVGCGMGRVLWWWAERAPGQRIVGVELDPGLAEGARRRLRRHPDVTIVTGEASASIPGDGTLFFLFNSFFGRSPWVSLRDTLESTRRGDTRVRLLCHNIASHLDVFRETRAWDIEVIDLGGDPAAPLGQLAVIRMRA